MADLGQRERISVKSHDRSRTRRLSRRALPQVETQPLSRVTSPRDPRYNCFAFAANDTQHIWEYTRPGRLGGYFWPAEIKGDSLNDFIRVYGLLGFQECDDDALEPEVVKLAIYVDREGAPCHIARQTRQGWWKSKLGIRGKDIEHASLDLLAGEEADEYGRVAKLLKKRRYETEDLDNAQTPAPHLE